MKFVAKQVDDTINSPKNSPVKEFLLLSAGLGIILSSIILILSLLSDFLVGYIPVEMEKDLFSNRVKDVYIDGKSKKEDDLQIQTEAYMNRIAEKLAKHLPKNHHYQVSLSNQDIPNAFALPGGDIVVTKGLLKNVQTENGLAMVIAHELGHQYYRHPLRSLGRTLIITLAISSIVGLENNDLTTYLSSGVNLALLSFSRDHEREADQLGRDLLIKTYGHLNGATEFFENMESHDFSSIPEFFLTHPKTANRIQKLKTERSGEVTPLPPTVKQYLDANP